MGRRGEHKSGEGVKERGQEKREEEEARGRWFCFDCWEGGKEEGEDIFWKNKGGFFFGCCVGEGKGVVCGGGGIVYFFGRRKEGFLL